MALRLIQRRYSTFISNAFTHCRNSSTIGAPIQESISRNAFSCKPSTISQKRFFFKHRESDDEGYWFHNPNRVRFTLIFLGCGALIGVTSGGWITVPYSERSHFVLFHKLLPKTLPIEPLPVTDESVTVLPPFHPDTLTARRIYQDILRQASQIQMKKAGKKQDEESEKGMISETFQILVVDSPGIGADAASGGSGKIYFTSGMIHYEAMIAAIIGHEVGHDLAGYNRELFSKFISLVSGIGTTLYLFSKSTYVRSKMPYFDKFMRLRIIPTFCFVVAVPLLSYLPMMYYLRKLEVEADYMGLMSASSAGYNPLVGSTFPIYYGIKTGKDRLPKWFYPVPPAEERCEILAHPRIMNEAISRHQKATERQQGKQPPAKD